MIISTKSRLILLWIYGLSCIMLRKQYNIKKTGGSEMIYCIKHFDSVLLKFSANAESSEPDYRILWVDETKRELLPLTLELFI